MHRQAEDFPAGPHGLRQLEPHGERRQPVERRRVVHTGFHTAVGQPGRHRVPVADTHRVLVVDMHRAVREGGRADTVDTGQTGVQVLGVELAGRRPCRQPPELDPPDGRVDIGHPVVEAHDLVGVAPLHALVAQEANGSGDLGVGGDDHASLPARHVLGREETERCRHAPGTDRHSVQCRRVRLAGVLDDRQPVPVSERDDAAHRRRVPVQVDWHDRRGTGCDGGLDRRRVEAEMARLDVDEHRRTAGEADRVRGGGERERGDDDLVAGSDTGCDEGEVQRAGAGVHRDAMPPSDQGGKLSLESRHFRALGEMAAGQHPVDRGPLGGSDQRLG